MALILTHTLIAGDELVFLLFGALENIEKDLLALVEGYFLWFSVDLEWVVGFEDAEGGLGLIGTVVAEGTDSQANADQRQRG